MRMTDVANAMKIKQPSEKRASSYFSVVKEAAGVPDVFKAFNY